METTFHKYLSRKDLRIYIFCCELLKEIGSLDHYLDVFYITWVSWIVLVRSCIQPQLDCWDIVFDQSYKEASHKNFECIQYNACLVITVAIWGTSRQKLYQELGLESLKDRCWFKKIVNSIRFSKRIPLITFTHITRNPAKIPLINNKHQFVKSSFPSM